MNRILIVGATGVLGSEAAKHFIKKGFQVNALLETKKRLLNLHRQAAYWLWAT